MIRQHSNQYAEGLTENTYLNGPLLDANNPAANPGRGEFGEEHTDLRRSDANLANVTTCFYILTGRRETNSRSR